MMGGVTSGAMVTAMEMTSGKRLIWSSTQFVSYAPAQTDFYFEIKLLAQGRRITQAQGSMFDGERLVLVTSAALGEMDHTGEHDQPVTQDDKPEVMVLPEQCTRKEDVGVSGGLMDQFERRVAQHSDADGFESLWFRLKSPAPTSTGLLAVLGDFLPGAVSYTRGSSSVDNTLRVNCLEDSTWLLAESRIRAVRGRLFQGSMNIFSEKGRLLAHASQSGIRPKSE